MVTLTNLIPYMQSLQLTHDYCEAVGSCSCLKNKHVYFEVVPGIEKLAPREEERMVPTSLVLPAHPYHVSAPLPDAILDVPSVKAALSRPNPTISYQPVAEPAPTPAPARESKARAAKE